MRLPRKYSMTSRADFARVKTTGQAKAGRWVILSTLAEPSRRAPKMTTRGFMIVMPRLSREASRHQ